MNLKQRIDQNLKSALLSGDKTLATTLRGLKSVILNAEVATGKRDEGLDEQSIIDLFSREAKKRQESADLYQQGGSPERAAAEIEEKRVIEQYLPKQLSDEELAAVVDEVVSAMGGISQQTMGQAIRQVRARVGASADGGRIANAVKERLS